MRKRGKDIMTDRDYMQEAKNILQGYSTAISNYNPMCIAERDRMKAFWDVITIYMAVGMEYLDKGTI